MANPLDRNVLFELEGSSLDAAKALISATNKAVREIKPQTLGNVAEIHNDWARLFALLHEKLRTEQPDLLQATGLLSPATLVYKGRGTLPRAYIEYPHIYTSPEQKPRFFMFCPIDYQGQHFTPVGGRLITGKEEAHIGNLLFAGGWLDNAPIFSMNKMGTSTPVDYKPPRVGKAQDEFERVRRQNTQVCFIAAGRSLEIVQALADFDKNFSRSCDKYLKLVKTAIKRQFPELLKNLPQGEKLYINSSYGYGGHHGRGVEFDISVRQSGKINIMAGGQPVELLESPYFNATRKNGEYTITPRTDTTEGKKIAAAYAAIPQKTFIYDYPELQANFVPVSDQISKMLGSDQPFPRIHHLSGFAFLVYGAKVKDKISFCPPDAIPVSTALYEWLKSDESDQTMGVPLPPRPQTVITELARLQQTLNPAPPTAKKPDPVPQKP
ncbi:MAG: hypothetical protein NDJ24_05865 [Alphaproteobacteria bacterium]|nr:hypothetical protein [Alphaproteobacteria bacterium]